MKRLEDGFDLSGPNIQRRCYIPQERIVSCTIGLSVSLHMSKCCGYVSTVTSLDVLNKSVIERTHLVELAVLKTLSRCNFYIHACIALLNSDQWPDISGVSYVQNPCCKPVKTVQPLVPTVQ